MSLRYASVCDGIGCVHVAWRALGFNCAWTSEIEAFPMAVVDHHWGFANLGDMTQITDEQLDDHGRIDILVGGTPCQSFSVAGLRKGLADPRGNLALAFLGLADRTRAKWVVWENVPGVLSSGERRDFGCFLGGLAECGYGFAYRVLDAQYFGLAQRRKRVFVVGCLGDWRRAAAVLFERACLSGNPAPSREAGQVAAPTIAGSANGGGANGPGRDVDSCESLVAMCLNAGGMGRIDAESETLLPVAFAQNQVGEVRAGAVVNTLNTNSNASGRNTPMVTYSICGASDPLIGNEVAQPMTLRHGDPGQIARGMAVRRLTPRECERLQGFPDDYTLITYRGKPAADGPRYRALGNSMARPVMQWIGARIKSVHSLSFPSSTPEIGRERA